MWKNGNLAYLSWLNKQTKVTWVIVGILFFLLMLNIYNSWQRDNNSAVGNNPLPAENTSETVELTTKLPETEGEESPKIVTEEVPLEIVPNLPETIYVNPLAIPGYQPPCSGKVLCPFGVNFDERYGDYRYHQGVVYQLSKNEVKAALAGTIVRVYQENEEMILVLEEGTYQLVYKGLTEIAKDVGDSVNKGEQIGTALQELTVEAIYYQ